MKIPKYKIKMVRDGEPINANGPKKASDIIRSICCEDPIVETMVVLFLDGRNNVRGASVVSQGGRYSLSISTPEIFRPAIVFGAVRIILGHNHPSGSLAPSIHDDRITKRAKNAGEIIGIDLVDHIIVTEDGYFSMLEEGLLDYQD